MKRLVIAILLTMTLVTWFIYITSETQQREKNIVKQEGTVEEVK